MSDQVYTANKSTGSTAANGCPITAMSGKFKPLEKSYLDDPYKVMAEMRESEPVFYSPELDYWVVSRYADVKAMLRDPETFPSDIAQSPMKPWPQEAADYFAKQNFVIPPVFSNNNPPSHTHVRNFTNDAFTPKQIRQLEPMVRQIVGDAIDKMIPLGRADLVKEVLYETPARVLFAFLGIPNDDLESVKVWSQGRAVLTWGMPSEEEIIELMPNFVEFLNYSFEMIGSRMEKPPDDYAGELAKKLKAGPEGITQPMVAIMLFGLLMAGHETTSNQSALGIRALLTHRESWEAICADPKLIPNAMEETIRYDSSVISWRRVAAKDVEIAGVTIPKGSKILVMLGAANRDSAEFKNAETFDIHRKNPRRNMSFGHGIHYCLGAPLARLELRIFLEEFTKRIPSLRLVEGQEYEYSKNTTHRGPTSLWAEWDI